MTPLHWAVNEGHIDVVEFLLTSNADVNAKNALGATPLHLAAFKGNKGLARLLMNNKAQVNATNNDGENAC